MSAAKRVAHAAETIRARWEQRVASDPQTEAAQALEDTGQLLDPEVAAELERLQSEAKSSRVDWERLLRAEQRRAELEAVLGTHRKDDEATIERLRARVAELEAERHTTNEALDDAVQALRAKERSGDSYPPALPWARLMDDEDLTDFLDELAASAITHASSDVALAEVEKTCATWRLIAEAQHGHNTAPGPDRMTATFAPVASLREPLEDPHDGPLHHDYRVGRDLPETGSTK